MPYFGQGCGDLLRRHFSDSFPVQSPEPLMLRRLVIGFGCLVCSVSSFCPADEPLAAVNGNSSIRGLASSSEIVITTTDRLAAAIHSLTWSEKESIDSHRWRLNRLIQHKQARVGFPTRACGMTVPTEMLCGKTGLERRESRESSESAQRAADVSLSSPVREQLTGPRSRVSVLEIRERE